MINNIKLTTETSDSSKRIAKNTFILYIRMFLTMGISLYTSRVVLEVLGVEDYGIYSVVGGIIALFSFINGGMVSATQRYITFEIGKGSNIEQLKNVFSTSLQVHAIISILVIILGETVGLFFLYDKLVIPASRMTAAAWVYQCSIIVCIGNIMSVPYNADIIAHEKMSAFAYISILEVIFKLAIVYLLMISQWDKLMIYAILLLCTQLLIRFVYACYCKNHFEESKYRHRVDKALLKEMACFAGWNFFGHFAGVLYLQGVNIMLNIFFGPVVNAARAIAVQVQTAVQQFIINFQMAINPQITKNYAIGNLKQMHSLIFRSARFSFFLLYFFALPVILETHFLLTVWLEKVPDDTVIFTQLMILISLNYTTVNPCIIANQATGDIKKYQVIVGGILLLILPISYLVLKFGLPVYSVFLVHFCIELVAQLARMYMLRHRITLPVKAYLINVYIPIILVAIVSSILPVVIRDQLDDGLLRLIIVCFTCVISVVCSVFLLGFTKIERELFLNKLFQFLHVK